VVARASEVPHSRAKCEGMNGPPGMRGGMGEGGVWVGWRGGYGVGRGSLATPPMPR